ncbi:MAG TPA: hypothetical protein VMO52_07865 [Acidimicrobiia bacterium]|nr:hypothetical protein [Acidimicrobiia bacterium]
MQIAIFHEHPDWNAPLFAELDRRGVDHISIDASRPDFDPHRLGDWALVFNRMSPSAWTRGHMAAMLGTPVFLQSVEAAGIPVINGSAAYEYELSKRNQLELFRKERVQHPEGRPVLSLAEIPEAANALEFPVMVKPNVGGSGAGIVAFDNRRELAAAVESGSIDLGPDGTGVVQEQMAPRGESIVRVEILGGEFLYAIALKLLPGSFNLCPADYCDPAQGVGDPSDLVERVVPPAEVVVEAARIISATGADLGGVEYLVNDHDGGVYFYDINAMSNYVADPENVLGFNPYVDLVDYLVARISVASHPGTRRWRSQ